MFSMNEDAEHKSCGLRVRCQLPKGAIKLPVAVGRTVFAARFYAGGTNPASGQGSRHVGTPTAHFRGREKWNVLTTSPCLK